MSQSSHSEFTLRVAMGNPKVSFSAPNSFTLNLPSGWNSQGNQMALEALYIYNSFFNISVAIGNNTFSYIIHGTTYAVTIPDGIYQYADLNTYLQQVMYANGHYLIDNNGNTIYYLSIVANSVAYAVLLQATPVPSSLPSGWTNPAALTLSGTCPQLVVNNTGFAAYLGFAIGSFPPTAQSTPYSINSSVIPQVTQIQTINVNCNVLALNPLTANNVLATFSPTQTAGSLINYVPFNIDFMPVADTIHTAITLSLTNQNGTPIPIYDTTGVVFVLKVVNNNRR